MHRRRFAQLLAGMLAPLWGGCRPRESDTDAVARLLGLRPDERAWLTPLAPAHLEELRAGLETPEGARADRAVERAFDLLGHRRRTFAFVGYPQVNDRRSACDGLLRE